MSWQIFPCVKGGKTPAVPRGYQVATNDRDIIDSWAKAYPSCNWGIACGLSGLFVVDVDLAGIEAWRKLLNDNPAVRAAVETTYTVQTPKGGYHFYFYGEGRTSASKIAAGIDTRGVGGYVIAAGGQVGENKYTALTSPNRINQAPQFLIDLVASDYTERRGEYDETNRDSILAVSRASEVLLYMVGKNDVAISGQGGQTKTFVVACKMLESGVSKEKALELISNLWNPHCIPPWTEHELKVIIHNAAEYGQETANAGKALQSAQEVFGGIVSELPKPASFGKYQFVTWREAIKNVTPQRWLINGFLPETGVSVLYGSSQSYKTFVALDWALTLATGITGLWETAATPKTILYFIGEGQSSFIGKRVRAWTKKRGIENPENEKVMDNLILVKNVPAFTDAVAWQGIREQIEALGRKIDVLVIDTFSKATVGMDENSAKDAAMAIGMAQTIGEYTGGAVLILHHTGRGKNAAYRGSSVIESNVDTMILSEKVDDNSRVIKLKPMKHKDADINKPVQLQAIIDTENDSLVLDICTDDYENKGVTVGEAVWLKPQYITGLLYKSGTGTATDADIAAVVSMDFGVDLKVAKREIKKKRENGQDVQYLNHNGIWKMPKTSDDFIY